MSKNNINVYDNFLSKEEYQFILDYCFSASYCYGESDSPLTKPTGMVHNVYNTEQIDFFNLFESKIKEKFSSVIESKELYRMYINCFAPSENPYFHTDGEGYTFLYYANDTWDIDDGGETQFFIDNNLCGITPIPNRLVYFDASILHKATSFRDKHRFTVAVKYR
jgi:Rps23 Pro-64 3,4-dihydroxylase Tpa1-like proline 4-hydroxylase